MWQQRGVGRDGAGRLVEVPGAHSARVAWVVSVPTTAPSCTRTLVVLWRSVLLVPVWCSVVVLPVRPSPPPPLTPAPLSCATRTVDVAAVAVVNFVVV